MVTILTLIDYNCYSAADVQPLSTCWEFHLILFSGSWEILRIETVWMITVKAKVLSKEMFSCIQYMMRITQLLLLQTLDQYQNDYQMYGLFCVG